MIIFLKYLRSITAVKRETVKRETVEHGFSKNLKLIFHVSNALTGIKQIRLCKTSMQQQIKHFLSDLFKFETLSNLVQVYL